MAAARNGSERSSDHVVVPSWCVHFYKYEATLLVGDSKLEITTCSVGIIPPGVSHEYQYRGRSEHLYAHFNLRSAGGEAMPIAGPIAGEPRRIEALGVLPPALVVVDAVYGHRQRRA